MVATDHLGNEFKSVYAMCEHYGISTTSYKYRLEKLGWPLKRVLEEPLHDTNRTTALECRDHKGNAFPSMKAMCDFWRIPRQRYYSRIRSGWTMARALETPIDERMSRSEPIKAPNGKLYANVDLMCEAYGISKTQYMTNVRNGLSMKRALTEMTAPMKRPRDHKGREFASINAMCRHYGITKTTLRARLELGWTLKRILETPQDMTRRIECVDHEGRRFPTLKAMLKYHGISYTNFIHRRDKLKLPLDQCLSHENMHIRRVKDHYGNEFACLQDMQEYWSAKPGQYHQHRKNGQDVKKCLIGDYRKGMPLPPGLEIKKNLGNGYYIMLIDGMEQIWTDVMLHTEIRKHRIEDVLYMRNGRLSDGTIVISRFPNGYYEIEKDSRRYVVSADILFRMEFLTEKPL